MSCVLFTRSTVVGCFFGATIPGTASIRPPPRAKPGSPRRADRCTAIELAPAGAFAALSERARQIRGPPGGLHPAGIGRACHSDDARSSSVPTRVPETCPRGRSSGRSDHANVPDKARTRSWHRPEAIGSRASAPPVSRMRSPRRASPPLTPQRATTGSAGRCACCAIVGGRRASRTTGLHHGRRRPSDPVRPALAAADPVIGARRRLPAATCQKRSAATFSSGERPPPRQWNSPESCMPRMRARPNSSASEAAPRQLEVVGDTLCGGPARGPGGRSPLRPSRGARRAHVEMTAFRRLGRGRRWPRHFLRDRKENGPPWGALVRAVCPN